MRSAARLPSRCCGRPVGGTLRNVNKTKTLRLEAIVFSAAGDRSAATEFHFFVNLRTLDHFDASAFASIERTRQK